MQALMPLLLTNLAMACGLILVAWLFSKSKKQPALVHALWVLALIKLITPPWIPVPILPKFSVHKIGSTPIEQTNNPVTGMPDATPVVRDVRQLEPEIPRDRSSLSLPSRTVQSSHPPGNSTLTTFEKTIPQLLLGIWGIGTVSLFGLAFIRIRKFRALLRLTQPAPPAILKRARVISNRLGLHNSPSIELWNIRSSPFLWAASRPSRLILPVELLSTLSSKELESVLAHELAHFARRDHWVRILETVVVALYWWFPPVWWARKQLRIVEEQCCDAWVVWILPHHRKEYANALIRTVEFLNHPRETLHLPALASAITNGKHAAHLRSLKLRLTLIMKTTTRRRLSWQAKLSLAAFTLFCVPTIPTQAQEESRQALSPDAIYLRNFEQSVLENERSTASPLLDKRPSDSIAVFQDPVASIEELTREINRALANYKKAHRVGEYAQATAELQSAMKMQERLNEYLHFLSLHPVLNPHQGKTKAVLLLEVQDRKDPVYVGEKAIYEIKVTNLGNQAAENVQLNFVVSAELEVQGNHTEKATADGIWKYFSLPEAIRIEPSEAYKWQVNLPAKHTGAASFTTELVTESLEKSVVEREMTHILPHQTLPIDDRHQRMKKLEREIATLLQKVEVLRDELEQLSRER